MGLETQKSTTREALLERYHTVNRRNAGLDSRSRRMMFKSFARTLGPWLPLDKDALILDVACGEGALLAFLRDRGYTDLSGFDLSPENVAICQQRGLVFVRQYNALCLSDFQPSDEVDAIFCLDLIEHLEKEHAVPFLRQAYSRLKQGGALVLQTPNMGSVVGLFHRYNDLTHEFALTEDSLLSLLLTAGFPLDGITIRPAWNATTILGYVREAYLRMLHLAVYLSEGRSRPRVPTKNLLARGVK